MNWRILCKLLGLLALLVGGAMLLSLPWAFPALGVARTFELRGFVAMLGAMLVSMTVGLSLTWLGRKSHGNVLQKEALAVVGLGWILAGLLGALPYLFGRVMLSAAEPMSVVDALFESVSGFTTTGASVLTELENSELVPKCIMFWRCFTQWLGGMGIIVLFIALLGNMGTGGKALLHREVTGPINETVMPRVRETALFMWQIYMGLSALLAVIFLFEGMTVFDALCHTFATIASGGFSTHNRSVAYFDSVTIEVTMTIFMILAGTNFSLFYVALHGSPRYKSTRWWSRLTSLFRDREWICYLAILCVATCALSVNLLITGRYDNVATALRHASFLTVSVMTTTGFGTEDFSQWSEFAKGLLLLLMFVGGCAGSTAGGIKVVRFLLFFSIIRLEIEKSFRPRVVRVLRLGKQHLPDTLRHDVVVYFSLILFIFVSSWMLLNTIEPDTQWKVQDQIQTSDKLIDCASAVAATLNNIGPGLGVLGPASNFSEFSPQGKFLLVILMLLGRLELFAVLVLFFPSFWRNQ